MLQTPNGEPATLTQPSDGASKGTISLQRFAAAEAASADAVADASASLENDPKQNAAPEPSAHDLDRTHEHMMTMRRAQEFASEGQGEHKPRAWDGAAREGTVVAADAGGLVMHVGRNDYMRIPAPPHADHRGLVGHYATIDRAGNVSTPHPTAHERSRAIHDRSQR